MTIRPSGVVALAANTVREAVRSRVLYTLLGFAIVMIATGVVLSSLSYVERDRIMQDVGLAAIRLFGAAIAIFVGVGLIYKEVERRTIYTILSKPVHRAEFLVGKYVGLVATLWLQVGVMSAAFVLVSWMAGAPISGGHMAALAAVAVEVAVLVAVATFFSSFTTPMLASLFTAGFYVVGHLTRDLRELGAQSGVGSLEWVTRVLYWVLPDLESFNFTIEAVHGLPIAPVQFWLPVAYAAGVVGVLLVASALVFERRDFR